MTNNHFLLVRKQHDKKIEFSSQNNIECCQRNYFQRSVNNVNFKMAVFSSRKRKIHWKNQYKKCCFPFGLKENKVAVEINHIKIDIYFHFLAFHFLISSIKSWKLLPAFSTLIKSRHSTWHERHWKFQMSKNNSKSFRKNWHIYIHNIHK